MPIQDYTDAVSLANKCVNVGSFVRSPRIYYQAHKVTGPFVHHGGYVGKWSRNATALDARSTLSHEVVEDMRTDKVESPNAMHGKVIAYQCSEHPTPPELFLMTKQHRGQRGFIAGDAFCVIEIAMDFVR